MTPTLTRILRFNAVGVIGFAVQLTALAALHSGLGLNYAAATAIAVELAVLHNFIWHERWTWQDRGPRTDAFIRLLRFNLGTGAVSLAVNVTLMQFLAARRHVPYLAANLVSVAAATLANYAVADRLVFKQTW